MSKVDALPECGAVEEATLRHLWVRLQSKFPEPGFSGNSILASPVFAAEEQHGFR